MDEEQLSLGTEPEPDEKIEIIDGRQFFYIDPRVRREYLATRKISPAAFAVYATLCDFTSTPGPTVAALTAQSGLKSSNTTRKAMRALIKCKLIAVVRVKDKYNHNQPNQYTLLDLPPIDTSKIAVPQNLNPAPQKMKGNSLESCIDQSLVSGSDPVLNRDSQRAEATLPPTEQKSKAKTKAKNMQPHDVIKDFMAEMLFGTKAPLKDKWPIIVRLWNDLEMPSVDRLRTFEQWWYREDFRGKQHARPTHGQVKAEWEHAFNGKASGNSALPVWWPKDVYGRPHTYNPPLTAQEYAWADMYHATILKDLWHAREKWPQLVAAHLRTLELEATK